MATFLEAAACKGRRPDEATALVHYPRHDLVSRLLVERDVPRFVVAPDGFGKTSLIAEYCDMITGFKHTFWINGRSPFFLRDLDAATMVGELERIDHEHCLIVFEDVPRFTQERSRAFAKLLDDLLIRGNEVIVSCQPTSDVYGDLHRDRLLLSAEDLILSDDESNVATKIDTASPLQLFPLSERIACLRWSSAGGKELLEGIRREDLPQDWLLAMAFMLVIQRGTFGDLCRIMEADRASEVWSSLAQPYGFLGIDRHEGQFCASALGINIIAETIAPQIRKYAHLSLQGTLEGFVAEMADILLEQGSSERATQALCRIGTVSGSYGWLMDHGWGLIAQGRFLAVLEVYDVISRSKHSVSAALSAMAAWAFIAMNEPGEAKRKASCGLRRSEEPADLLMCASAHLFERGRARTPEELRHFKEAVAVEEALMHADGIGARREAVLRTVAAMMVVGGCDPDDGLGCGMRLMQTEVPAFLTDARMAVALCLMRRLQACAQALAATGAQEAGEPDAGYLYKTAVDALGLPLGREETSALLMAVCDDATSQLKAHPESWLAAETVTELCRTAETLKVPDFVPDGDACRLARAACEAALSQRALYAKDRHKHERAKITYDKTHPDPFRKQTPTPSASVPVAPTLHVRLFGGMRVRVGKREVSMAELAKRKARLLLALLVLKNGNELSRDLLATMLWPESAPERAKKNLYTSIGLLKRLLDVDGSCPYIIIDLATIRIDMTLVSTDLIEFTELCNALLGGSHRVADWEAVFNAMSVRYSAELLPSETGNDLIDEMRELCHTNLVEALVAAARQQLRDGADKVALRLSREAMRRDDRREDVYAIKMEAEMANGLREEAMRTYFACRTYLTEGLGIDPSPGMMDMYRALLLEEVPA